MTSEIISALAERKNNNAPNEEEARNEEKQSVINIL